MVVVGVSTTRCHTALRSWLGDIVSQLEGGGRVVRLFIVSLVPQLIAVPGHLTRSIVFSLIVGTAEAVYGQLVPTDANTESATPNQ